MNDYQKINSPNIERLVKDNIYLVKKIAWHVHGRVQSIIDIEDLVQIGMVGLISSAQNYKPQKDATFSSYANFRIKGEMLDFLRKNSNLCRTTIKKKQEFEKRKMELQRKLNREPTKNELIEFLDVTDEEFVYWEKAFEANNVQSLDQAYDEYSVLFASQNNDPEAALQDKELKNQIRDALKVLNKREAMIAQLYYVEELNIYEISDILEISTGRISQIKKAIIEKLRDEISF